MLRLGPIRNHANKLCPKRIETRHVGAVYYNRASTAKLFKDNCNDSDIAAARCDLNQGSEIFIYFRSTRDVTLAQINHT